MKEKYGKIYLTVVIPTLNRDRLLSKTLESISLQTLSQENFEVIVVDNGSTDNTKNVVEGYKGTIKQLMYIYESSFGLHVGRNRGFQMANGDFIVYADDDIYAFPTWLEVILNTFNQSVKIGLVGGSNLPCFEEKQPNWFEQLWQENKYGRIMGAYSLIDFGDIPKEIESGFVWGCNYAIRKDILKLIGGFNPDGMPNDLIFYRGDGETAVSKKVTQLGYKTYFHPHASVFHHVSSSRMTYEYLKKRYYAQGISDSYTLIRDKGYVLHSDLITLKLNNEQKKQIAIKDDLLDLTQSSYWQGYYNHHVAVYKNKNLLDWILKENYLGENGIVKYL